MDPKHYLKPEDERRRYELHENTCENQGYVDMFERFWSVVLPHIQNVKTVLDYGCGTEPVFAKILRQKEYSVDTYDKYFAPQRVYQEKTYDLVTLTEVLEHIADPTKLFALLAKHVRPGGYIAFMTLFHPENDEAFLKWWYRRDPTHISFYSIKTIDYLCKSSNMALLFTDRERIGIIRKAA